MRWKKLIWKVFKQFNKMKKRKFKTALIEAAKWDEQQTKDERTNIPYADSREKVINRIFKKYEPYLREELQTSKDENEAQRDSLEMQRNMLSDANINLVQAYSELQKKYEILEKKFLTDI